ncbi:hypothetical protein H8959_009907 [Pygathrix nigripes]
MQPKNPELAWQAEGAQLVPGRLSPWRSHGGNILGPSLCRILPGVLGPDSDHVYAPGCGLGTPAPARTCPWGLGHQPVWPPPSPAAAPLGQTGPSSPAARTNFPQHLGQGLWRASSCCSGWSCGGGSAPWGFFINSDISLEPLGSSANPCASGLPALDFANCFIIIISEYLPCTSHVLVPEPGPGNPGLTWIREDTRAGQGHRTRPAEPQVAVML